MNPKEALDFLVAVISEMPLKMAPNTKVREAVGVLSKAIEPPSEPGEGGNGGTG